LGTSLGALSNIADSNEVFFCKSILVALQNDSTGIDLKGYEWHNPIRSGFSVIVVVSVLQQLEHESSVAVIKILGQPVPMSAPIYVEQRGSTVIYVMADGPIILSCLSIASSTSRRILSNI
jgi:hypothetical protein